MPPPPRSSPRQLIAQREVEQVLAQLPPEFRAEAAQCQIMFADEDAEDRELLGLFEGNARNDPEPQSAEELPRITLYLQTLWDYCERDPRAYRDEVRTTLLHELGHYLGLDEDQIEAMGLG